MYYRVTDEHQKLVDIFKSHIIGFSPRLSDDASPEVVEAYNKFLKISKEYDEKIEKSIEDLEKKYPDFFDYLKKPQTGIMIITDKQLNHKKLSCFLLHCCGSFCAACGKRYWIICFSPLFTAPIITSGLCLQARMNFAAICRPCLRLPGVF